MQIKDTVAIVTGGASGLGEATVEGLVARGGRVAIFDVNEQAGEALSQKLGDRVLFCKVDVTSESSATEAVKKTVDTFGALHICVNCAGIPSGSKTVGKAAPHSLDLFKKVIDINLNGTFNVLRLGAFEMAKNKPLNENGERGVIVNTASGAAFDGQQGQAAYAASKAGICGMTLPIARDLSKLGIRIVTIAPGLFLTPIFKDFPQAMIDGLVAHMEFPKRPGKPSEYADLVAHIIETPYLNGEVIRFDAAGRLPAR
jgi:3-hydroxyacyl-CoA dehydrogenase / 3-hydroxy-2-methylbutyryl-CoA dehydrogenase